MWLTGRVAISRASYPLRQYYQRGLLVCRRGLRPVNPFPTEWNLLFMTFDAGLDWIVQCLTSPPTQYRLYGRRFLQVKRPNQQYQSTEGKSTREQSKQRKQLNTQMDTQ